MRTWIDLNSDMGESFGNFVLGRPEEVMKRISHANIACGFHAGDPTWMRRTVEWAKQYGVTVGAHPGFPDLMGLGRRLMNLTAQEAKDYVVYQAGALKAFCEMNGIKLQAAKPHGAFFSWGMLSEENAQAILAGFQAIDPELTVYLPALPHFPLVATAEKMGFRVVKEFYPGLSYDDSGAITVKRAYGEESVEEIVALVLRFAIDGKTTTTTGAVIDVEGESVCVHGDVINAPEVLDGLHTALRREGIEVRSAINTKSSDLLPLRQRMSA
jgi:5-oxoprolinase (ATP-hydrolysing) subunit A